MCDRQTLKVHREYEDEVSVINVISFVRHGGKRSYKIKSLDSAWSTRVFYVRAEEYFQGKTGDA